MRAAFGRWILVAFIVGNQNIFESVEGAQVGQTEVRPCVGKDRVFQLGDDEVVDSSWEFVSDAHYEIAMRSMDVEPEGSHHSGRHYYRPSKSGNNMKKGSPPAEHHKKPLEAQKIVEGHLDLARINYQEVPNHFKEKFGRATLKSALEMHKPMPVPKSPKSVEISPEEIAEFLRLHFPYDGDDTGNWVQYGQLPHSTMTNAGGDKKVKRGPFRPKKMKRKTSDMNTEVLQQMEQNYKDWVRRHGEETSDKMVVGDESPRGSTPESPSLNSGDDKLSSDISSLNSSVDSIVFHEEELDLGNSQLSSSPESPKQKSTSPSPCPSPPPRSQPKKSKGARKYRIPVESVVEKCTEMSLAEDLFTTKN